MAAGDLGSSEPEALADHFTVAWDSVSLGVAALSLIATVGVLALLAGKHGTAEESLSARQRDDSVPEERKSVKR